MSWDNMFKKFGSKSKAANTYPVHGKGGEVLNAAPISDEPVSDMDDRERFEVLKAENKRLTRALEGKTDRGYEDALKTVFNRIEERDGRVGKNQILAMVQDMLEENRKEG